MAIPIDMLTRPSRQGAYRTAVLVTAAALFVAGLAGLRAVDRPMTPADIFQSAREFVAAHRSAHFDGTVAMTFSPGDDGSDDSEMLLSTKGRIFGDIERSRGMHMTSTTDDEGVNETLFVGKDFFWRAADDTGALAKALWAKHELEEGEDESIGFDSLFQGDLLAQLDDATTPRIVERFGDATKIRVDIKKPKGAPADMRAFMELVVADDGELRLVGTHIRSGEHRSDTVLRFSDWGQSVEFASPPADMIDPTPELNEESVLAWTSAPLYMPRNLPEDWVLDYAEVLPEDETVEGCEQVEIDFVPPDYYDNDDAPYVTLYELPTACAQPFEGVGVKAFQAGPYSGGVHTDHEGYTTVQIRIDDKTTLQAETTMPVAQLATLLADLVPLDFGKLNVAPLEAQSA